MCGRFTLYHSADELTARFALDHSALLFSPRYNIAPTQPTAVVIGSKSGRKLKFFRWGLVPFWSKNPNIGSPLINSRAETAAIKPSFRAAFKHRRCLIPASGYYEWQKTGAERHPIYIRRTDNTAFGFAGLWERWQGSCGEDLHSCTILTTTADERLSDIHDRMPVLLGPESEQAWLDPTLLSPERIQGLLEQPDRSDLTHYPVSTQLNKAVFDESACIEELPR